MLNLRFEKFSRRLVYGLAFIFTFACVQPSNMNDNQATTSPGSKKKIVVYQMMTRLFGNTTTNNVPYGTQEQNGVGKFNDITDKALAELSKMGITHIWYTGVIEHAVLTDYTPHGIPLDDADVVKGRAGSPYAIKDYYDVNPDLAEDVPSRMVEFEAMVTRTHEQGMQVIIDFVPNHVARFYQSDAKPEGVVDLGADDDNSRRFDPQNNFYYMVGEDFVVPADYHSLGDHSFPTKDHYFDEKPAKATGNDQFTATPSVGDWFETVKLNYGVDYENGRSKYFNPIPDTWNKMRDILLYWTDKKVDGFRCDMAEMVPVEFWEWVIPQIKAANPDIVFIAEIYTPDSYHTYINQGRFDYLYDKVELYDTLKHILQGHASTDDITQIWQRQDGIADNMLQFLENHDEQRIASPDFAGSAKRAIPAMVISTTMGRGPIMVYFGQEVGEPGAGIGGFSGEDGRTTIFDYWGVPEHQKWVNGGQFDGGGLSQAQQDLRNFYSKLLNYSNEHPAIAEGAFFDLHYFNRSETYTGYSNKVYAFLRYHEGDNLLIVANLNDQPEACKIKIPIGASEFMGFKAEESIKITGDFNTYSGFVATAQELHDTANENSIAVTIPASSFEIFKLTSTGSGS